MKGCPGCQGPLLNYTKKAPISSQIDDRPRYLYCATCRRFFEKTGFHGLLTVTETRFCEGADKDRFYADRRKEGKS